MTKDVSLIRSPIFKSKLYAEIIGVARRPFDVAYTEMRALRSHQRLLAQFVRVIRRACVADYDEERANYEIESRLPKIVHQAAEE